MFSRWWFKASILLATIGTVAIGVDTLGYVRAGSDTLGNQLWAFNYTVAVAIASVRLGIHSRRRTPNPTLAMFIAGLILSLIGGLDRFDSLTSSQIHTNMPDLAVPAAPVICFAAGLALITRFLFFPVPLIARPLPKRG